jgi:serine/threonine-protein kinase
MATYGLFFVASFGVASRARDVRVPDLTGASTADARARLDAAGLTFGADPLKRPDLTVPADHVLTQDPAAGTVLRRGRTVRVRLSDGAKLPPLPELVGLSETAAKAKLGDLKVQITATVDVRNAETATDTVVAQDPPARTTSRTVALLINRGVPGLTYVMPDLIGTPEARATELLRARGFRVAIVGYAAYPGLSGGMIIKQTPQAGFQMPPGETISLEVSR